jgi:hypothetical protein
MAALSELESLLPGLNYVVSLDLHRVPAIPGGTLEQYVAAALGAKAVVGGTAEVPPADMLAEVPVQWDFAYVLAGRYGAEVFIGSSSD